MKGQRTRRVAAFVLALFILVFFLSACAGLQLKQWSERTPQEKAYSVLAFYNEQFSDTMNMALRGNELTEEQKRVVRTKKAVLTKVYPLIQVYINYIGQGTVPPAETEAMILNYLNELGGRL
jgi:hypothetical protein